MKFDIPDSPDELLRRSRENIQHMNRFLPVIFLLVFGLIFVINGGLLAKKLGMEEARGAWTHVEKSIVGGGFIYCLHHLCSWLLN